MQQALAVVTLKEALVRLSVTSGLPMAQDLRARKIHKLVSVVVTMFVDQQNTTIVDPLRLEFRTEHHAVPGVEAEKARMWPLGLLIWPKAAPVVARTSMELLPKVASERPPAKTQKRKRQV